MTFSQPSPLNLSLSMTIGHRNLQHLTEIASGKCTEAWEKKECQSSSTGKQQSKKWSPFVKVPDLCSRVSFMKMMPTKFVEIHIFALHFTTEDQYFENYFKIIHPFPTPCRNEKRHLGVFLLSWSLLLVYVKNVLAGQLFYFFLIIKLWWFEEGKNETRVRNQSKTTRMRYQDPERMGFG